MTHKKFDYPDEETLKKVDRFMSRRSGSLTLSPDATPVEVLKFQLCAQFVIYIQEKKISQKELAELVGLSEARMSEILHYRNKRFTVDNLMKYLLKIKPQLKVKIA